MGGKGVIQSKSQAANDTVELNTLKLEIASLKEQLDEANSELSEFKLKGNGNESNEVADQQVHWSVSEKLKFKLESANKTLLNLSSEK